MPHSGNEYCDRYQNGQCRNFLTQPFNELKKGTCVCYWKHGKEPKLKGILKKSEDTETDKVSSNDARRIVIDDGNNDPLLSLNDNPFDCLFED